MITNKQARIILSALEEIKMFTTPPIQQKIFSGDDVEKICIIFTEKNHLKQEKQYCLGYLCIQNIKLCFLAHSQKYYTDKIGGIRIIFLKNKLPMLVIKHLNSRPEIISYDNCVDNKCS